MLKNMFFNFFDYFCTLNLSILRNGLFVALYVCVYGEMVFFVNFTYIIYYKKVKFTTKFSLCKEDI